MNAPNVLLIVDMLTSWDYEGAEEVAAGAEEAVAAINRLRAGRGDLLRVVFANDLDGGFHGSREKAFELAMTGQHPELVEPLRPRDDEDFIHKGQHSAFYGTPLAHLLDVFDARRVVVTGQVTEQCVLYTALDAHVRGYEVIVPTDAVISREDHLGSAALEMIESNMGGTLTTSRELELKQFPASAPP